MTTQDQKPRDSQMRAMIDQACEDLGRHGLQPTDEAAQVVLDLIVSASELGRLVRLRNEPSAEYFTGHSEGCNGKCGKGGFSSNSADYCEDQRKLLGRPSAVGALREIREEVGKYSTTFGATHLQAANDLAALVVKIVTIASEASGEAWCPEHHIPCRWGCEMDCFLRDCTPEEVATARAALTRSTEEA